MSKKARKRLIICIILLIVILQDIWGFSMKTVRYDVKTDKPVKSVRIVFISDLHNCFYGGTDQSGIIAEVNKAKPDIVCFGGDVIDAWGGTKYALKLMTELSKDYPCFYSPGNHEDMRDDKNVFYEEVKKICPVLLGNYEEITVNGQAIRIYGAPDAIEWGSHKTYLEECFDALDGKYYNILLAHRPDQIDSYLGQGLKTSESFDLILSGHAHGGQWRIPKLLDQGLYAPDQGIFPKYTSGIYHYGSTTHIISCGLAKPLRMIFIPRISNRPELSVIDINR